MNFEEVYAEPGATHIIDIVRPDTGLTSIFGETYEELKSRYPKAERLSWEAFKARAKEIQQTPILWAPSTREAYEWGLNCLPPRCWRRGFFLVGEPMDHEVETGRSRYTGYRKVGEAYFIASRPITVVEFDNEVERA